LRYCAINGGGGLNQAFRASAVEPLDTHPREGRALLPCNRSPIANRPFVLRQMWWCKHVFLPSLQQRLPCSVGHEDRVKCLAMRWETTIWLSLSGNISNLACRSLSLNDFIFSSNGRKVPVGRPGQLYRFMDMDDDAMQLYALNCTRSRNGCVTPTERQPCGQTENLRSNSVRRLKRK